MLPELPYRVGSFRRALTFVRELEGFEGPILSEYRVARGTARYIEKWCAHDSGVVRWLMVRTEERAIAEYLGGRIPMLQLLTESSDGVGFIVDRRGNEEIAVYLAVIESLPNAYLPAPHAMHDPSLRPEWRFIPQSFLIDDAWNAGKLANIERQYLNAEAFTYFTRSVEDRVFPSSTFYYEYEGGYPVMHALNAIRSSVPPAARARSVTVAASSPGVLTMEATAEAADDLQAALHALPYAGPAYAALHEWSRVRPGLAQEAVPPTASADIRRLSSILRVDPRKLFLQGEPDNQSKEALLVAAKLLAAYYRVLWRVVSPGDGMEFVSVKVDQQPPSNITDDEEP